uniref:Complement C1q tumor necrosis factor-related protein 3 n=1 Tax=Osmerus mordax TaxID=8014 RepID=C1BKF6_OSMMO|nr:Complement C1q tumor necrosis factor-related protein 3 precursor [Osmerus mordax]
MAVSTLVLLCSLASAGAFAAQVTKADHLPNQTITQALSAEAGPGRSPGLSSSDLQDLHDKMAALEARLKTAEEGRKNMETKITLLQKDKEIIEMKLYFMTHKVDELKVLEPRVVALQKEIEDHSAKLEQLKSDYEEKAKVAFSVGLQGGTLGPYNTPTTLIYRHITTNIGNGYSPNTGIFKAPVKGVYYLTFSCFKRNTVRMNVFMIRNSVSIAQGYDHNSRDGDDMVSNSVVVVLEAGDDVFIRLEAPSQIVGYERLTTFSGFLMFQE